MRGNIQAQDDSEFETVLMRRFHLTPGQPEYLVVKRRLSQEDADRQTSEPERLLSKGNRSKLSTQRKKREAAHTERGHKKPALTARASETVSQRSGGKVSHTKLSGTARGKHVKRPSGHKAGNMRKRNRSAA